jgi:hypothetical protein
MKEKEKDLELNTKQNIKNYLSCIVVKNADGKTLKQLDKLCLTCFEFGKREGCEGVIKEVEKLFLNGDPEFWVLYKKDWEAFKHGKK